MLESIQRLASFSDGVQGGNPAGVWIGETLPDAQMMQRMAAEVGYSETAFVAPLAHGRWRTRYFAPAMEVPFCGHATIALGAALATQHGEGVFPLVLNDAEISVEGGVRNGQMWAALQSPPTHSRKAEPAVIADTLALFGLSEQDLDPSLPPLQAHGGADHMILPLAQRHRLAAMAYDFEAGKALMRANGWVTIALVVAEGDQRFHVRNAFAAGGVVEDPATGAAAAALAGALRDQGWPHGNRLSIMQGDDMGSPSRITAELSDQPGSSIRVSGTVRAI